MLKLVSCIFCAKKASCAICLRERKKKNSFRTNSIGSYVPVFSCHSLILLAHAYVQIEQKSEQFKFYCKKEHTISLYRKFYNQGKYFQSVFTAGILVLAFKIAKIHAMGGGGFCGYCWWFKTPCSSTKKCWPLSLHLAGTEQFVACDNSLLDVLYLQRYWITQGCSKFQKLRLISEYRSSWNQFTETICLVIKLVNRQPLLENDHKCSSGFLNKKKAQVRKAIIKVELE